VALVLPMYAVANGLLTYVCNQA